MNETDLFRDLAGVFGSRELWLQLAQFLLWAVFILVVVRLLRTGINRTISDNALRYKARKVARVIGYVLVVLLAIVTFTGKVQYFTIAVGLVSAGLAFALQEVILSVAGWIAIYSTGIYKTGDRIEVNKIKGDVIDIGLTRTTLMEIGEWVNSDNYSGRIVQISNAFVFRGAVHNYSTDFPFVWDEINLPVRYGSDLDIARQIVLETATKHLSGYAEFAREHWTGLVKKYLIEDANVAPTLSLKLTDNWIELNLRYVVDYKQRRSSKTALYTDLLKAIQASEGKVTLASATYEVVGVPEIRIRKSEV